LNYGVFIVVVLLDISGAYQVLVWNDVWCRFMRFQSTVAGAGIFQ